MNNTIIDFIKTPKELKECNINDLEELYRKFNFKGNSGCYRNMTICWYPKIHVGYMEYINNTKKLKSHIRL